MTKEHNFTWRYKKKLLLCLKNYIFTYDNNIYTQGDGSNSFAFDKVFGMNTPQKDVFDYSIKTIVDGNIGRKKKSDSQIIIYTAWIDVTAGYNGTVFAYGQTGSGKTFTMMVNDILSFFLYWLIYLLFFSFRFVRVLILMMKILEVLFLVLLVKFLIVSLLHQVI